MLSRDDYHVVHAFVGDCDVGHDQRLRVDVAVDVDLEELAEIGRINVSRRELGLL